MGLKKPWAASGTWVLLVDVVGRLPDALMPLCTPPVLRPSVRDHLFWLPVPECAVAMDDGREGGRPVSPVGPVMPSTRLCSGVVIAGVSQSQSQSQSRGPSSSQTAWHRGVTLSVSDVYEGRSESVERNVEGAMGGTVNATRAQKGRGV